MQKSLSIHNIQEEGYNPEQERDFINNLSEIENSQDITTLLLHRIYKKIEDEKLEKASQEEKELFVKELLRKIEIVKKLIHDRPELAKNRNLLNAIINQPLAFAEKVLASHNNIQQQKSLHEYQQIMGAGLVTQKSILPAIFNEKSPEFTTNKGKSLPNIDKLFEKNEKTTEIQKEFLKSPTLDFSIKSIVQALREIFSSNKNHQQNTENKIHTIETKTEKTQEVQPINHKMTHLEKLEKQREEEEEKRKNNNNSWVRTK